MVVPSVRLLPVVAVAICTATLLTEAATDCSFVPKNFVCSKYNYRNFASNCARFYCKEDNGFGGYECRDSDSYLACLGYFESSSTAPWSIGSFVGISFVFIALSVVLLGVLLLLKRRLHTERPDTDKSMTESQPSRECGKRMYPWLYNIFFGFMYKNSGKERRSLCEFWIAQCELLNCFCCCGNRKARNEDLRSFYLRFTRLLATLSVGASFGMLFGSLVYDSVACTMTVSFTYSKLELIDSKQVSTRCFGSSAWTELALESTVVATLATQFVKFVGSYAQDVGKPGTKLDIIAHVVWCVAALFALPICYGISSHLMRADTLESTQQHSRMQTVLFVVIATWCENQGLDLVKMPFAYLSNCLFMLCFPKPSLDEKSQSVQPAQRELAEPKYAPGPEATNDEDKVSGEHKVDAIAHPTHAE